ncbi:MAG: hypothetical protein CMF24_08785 [Ilumatobacter sp.]|nr:hypothetical protein [Ilumatobacter sp.]
MSYTTRDFKVHEVEWKEYDAEDSSYESAVRYLKWRQNVQRDMCILSAGKLRRLACALTRFRNKDVSVTSADKRFYYKMTFGAS